MTKVASVAEEIENPDRNLPRGILVSMGVMVVLYTLVVAVIVGLNDGAALSTSGSGDGPSLTLMADGAAGLFGGVGVTAISVVGGLALLTQMGTFPILGAVGIVGGGVAWYLAYGRSRTEWTGAVQVPVDRWRGDRDEEVDVAD